MRHTASQSRTAAAPLLLVSEQPDYAEKLQSVMQLTAGLPDSLKILDTAAATEFLSACLAGADCVLPQLILVDLCLPEQLGSSFLWWLRAHRGFDRIPAIALGTCKQVQDVAVRRFRGADAYVYRLPSVTTLARACAAARMRRSAAPR